jgi:spore coat protein U-like protein
MMKPRRHGVPVRAFLLAAIGIVAGAAQAGTCSVSASGLAFGAYQPITFRGRLASADATTNATLTIACTGITSAAGYTVALGPSPVNNSMTPRYMAHDGGGPPMAFNVYRDAAYTSIWGDGVTGDLLSGSIAAGESTTTVGMYARIPGDQSVLRAGSYSANLAMTLTYEP